ncbi:ribonuclease H-like domain-containing protein [Tanacetum coccineum]
MWKLLNYQQEEIQRRKLLSVKITEPDPNVTLIIKLDVCHTLHLHQNDSSTLTIVSIKLKGTKNYNVWSCAMLLALEGRNKTGFIDNTYRRSNIDEVLGRQWDRVNVVFLMGLDDTYMQLRSNILAREPLPDAKGVYVLISREESHRAIVIGSGVGSSQRTRPFVFNSSVNNKGSTQRSQIPGNTSRPNSVSRPSNNGNRMVAGGPTMVYEHCRFNGQTIDSSTSSFFDEQISKLISLIKENSLNDNGKGFHANTAGANEQLTYTDKNLVNVIEALKTKVGNLVLTDFLTLYDVLVVPEYCVTLVSVHKVARDNKFIVGFKESKCFVMYQDLI